MVMAERLPAASVTQLPARATSHQLSYISALILSIRTFGSAYGWPQQMEANQALQGSR
jgi:hypothetical protein